MMNRDYNIQEFKIGRFNKKVYRRPLVLSDCLHDGCSDCHGTGRKEDGTMCIHYLSCPCSKCTPRC